MLCLCRHELQTVPTQDESALGAWLNVKWREKEERLRHFYNDGDGEFSDVSGETAYGDVGQESAEVRRRVETHVSLENVRERNEQVARVAMFAALIGWSMFIVVVSYLTYYSTWMRLFTLVIVVFYVIVTQRCDGLDMLMLQLHERQKLQRPQVQQHMTKQD